MSKNTSIFESEEFWCISTTGVVFMLLVILLFFPIFRVNQIYPQGTVMAFYDGVDKIPNGWLLCDGNNDTPDLRNRFILGASSSSSLIAPPLSYHTKDGIIHHKFIDDDTVVTQKIKTGHDTNHRYLNDESDQYITNRPFDIRPPFYKLIYIIKK